jgi:hypothetical protein
MYVNILRYRRGLYGWYAVGLLAAALLLYVSQDATDPPSGSTLQGYALGILGALLIVWLTMLGVRKRRYGSASNLQAWVSAHVYLGLALLGITLFHSAGQLGWNIHTITFALMVIVIFSGILGTYLYVLLPRQMSENRKGFSRDNLFEELGRHNKSCLELSAKCAPATDLAVRSSITGTTIGGGLLDQLLARDRSTFLGSTDIEDADNARPIANRGQSTILASIARLAPRVKPGSEAEALPALVSLIGRRQELLRRIRKDIQLQAWLEVWLYVHVPMTMAMLVGLVIHIVVVFMYW